VIRTMQTSTSLLPAQTFSRVRVASPRLTSPAIMLTQNPCAMSHACEAPSRPALVSIANARRCSAVRLIDILPGSLSRRAIEFSLHYFDRPAGRLKQLSGLQNFSSTIGRL
jgi:hypothetical protein